jgi:uncharacterized membrane protein
MWGLTLSIDNLVDNLGMFDRTGKGFFNVDHLARAGFHKSTAVFACVCEPVSRGYHSTLFEITLVACDDLHWRWPTTQAYIVPLFAQSLVVFDTLFSFHMDHVHEVIERFEACRVGDIVDQEERVRFQRRGRP